MTIVELQRNRDEARQHARTLATDLQQTAHSEGRPLSAAERSGIDAAIARAKEWSARTDQAAANASQSSEIDRLTAGLIAPGGNTTAYAGGSSLGAQILASDVGKYLIQNRGKFPSGVWVSPSSELRAGTLTEGGASGGALVIPDYRPGILPVPTRRLVVADLLAQGTTESNTISYMKETAFTNAAATVLEGTAKPESTLTFTAVNDPVRKVAHWVPVTEEMLEDVPALQSYLDARLRLGVLLKEDDQLLNGSGVDPDLTGILARVGLATAIIRGTDENADVILRQIAAIQTATGMEVSGIVMNPSNWLSVQLLKTESGEYIAGNGPFSSPVAPTLWGIPVALTPAITAGTALVGAFRTAAQVFRKGALRVEASNSHSDFFVRNLVAIRAEERLALAVYRPAAFGIVTGLN